MKYDSTLEFDDYIPGNEEYTDAKFFEVFGPVFKRNAYFSKKKPTPEFGDMNTPIKRVVRFYDFW